MNNIEKIFFSNETSFIQACREHGVKPATIDCNGGETIGANIFIDGRIAIKLILDPIEFHCVEFKNQQP
jgi:hypothetical protein